MGASICQQVPAPSSLRVCFVAAPLLKRPFADSLTVPSFYMCVLVLGVQTVCRSSAVAAAVCCALTLAQTQQPILLSLRAQQLITGCFCHVE
jgi:hypothetical protein